MFKVMQGLLLLQRCETRKQALEAFNTLMFTNTQPTSVFNSHNRLIYSRSKFLADHPDLAWLVDKE